jgi:archaeal flagellar protein FlaG
MDKAITTGLMIIAGIVASLALINAVIPAVGKSSGALLTANSAASDRIRTDIEIIHVASSAASGSEDQILVWVKNIGSNGITPLESTDIFLTTPSTIKRIPYGSGAEYWEYTLENGPAWTNGVTVKLTLHLANASVISGSYSVKVTVYNSVSAEKDFSV